MAQKPDALVFMKRALALTIELDGEEHPMTAACMHTLGTALAMQSRLREGEAMLKEALARSRATLGDDDLLVAEVLDNVAGVADMQRHEETARAALAESLAIYLAKNVHGGAANAEAHLAQILLNLHRFDEAAVHATHARLLWKQTDGTDDRKDEAELVLANIDCHMGRLDVARRRYHELRAAAAGKAYGGERRSDQVVLDEVDCEFEKGSTKRAAERLETTLPDSKGMAPLAKARLKLSLARAIGRGDRARALLAEARAELHVIGEPGEPYLLDADAVAGRLSP